MRAIAETDLRAFDCFTSVNGSAEDTTLSDHSIEIITVAQAFHWFDRQRFSVECRRVLVPFGIVVLVWNTRDETSELVRENETVIKKYCLDFKGYSGGTRGPESDDFNDFFVGNYDIKAFRNDLIFDEQGFIGRNLTGSYAPKEKDIAYPAYIEALKVSFPLFSTKNPARLLSSAGGLFCAQASCAICTLGHIPLGYRNRMLRRYLFAPLRTG